MRHVLTTPQDTVEGDFSTLQRRLSRSAVLQRLDAPDATAFWAPLPLVAVNVIADAHIPDAQAAERVTELIAPFVERGHPFQWITTPSTTTPTLESTLAQAGLRAHEYPAMHASLRNPVDPCTPHDVFIDIVWPDQVAPVTTAIFNNFGHAEDLADEHLDILETLDPETNHYFLARSLLNGMTLGAGTMHARGDSVMLANITVLPPARGRGLERALAATMMNRAASTGSNTATIVANHATYATYLELGFRTQFDVVTWVWKPHR
ncbi:GNAT family N-acetyltransferase [Nocardioides yefusunii]|uniref:GNAT family N-acetyltransferase n=1 Tax=Nocardioides yefusunii TaxID=2500546 RepID=A0ABW1R0B2_9ACTN|nr:GNAT family N-acetyltransferase [Nocardioides yefusunii]